MPAVAKTTKENKAPENWRKVKQVAKKVAAKKKASEKKRMRHLHDWHLHDWPRLRTVRVE